MVEQSGGNVRVLCRFRPLNQKEIDMNLGICAEFPNNTTVSVTSSQTGGVPVRFNFDYVFPPSSAQRDVYRHAAKPVVNAVMKGFNGTVFAYGQTSSGKTFTMSGPDLDDQEMMGIIPRMVSTVFQDIQEAGQHMEYSVKVSYAQIYLEKIRDLLDPKKNNLNVHQDRSRGVYIADLTQQYVSADYQVYDLMKFGQSNREVGYTHMNAGSSRSHSLFCITISQNNTLDFSAKTGKLYLVDLAGSEKVGKTGAAGKRLEEAKNINKSLTTLGLVIFSLTDGKSKHIPYRDSKLTRVLQDSLGGNSKTTLIVTCSPSPYNEAQTISTLRFGIRAKAIKNKAKVNREYTVAQLKLMLAKAKQEISNREKRIKQLQFTIKNGGSQVPAQIDIIEQQKEEAPTEPGSQVDGGEYDQVIVQLEQTRLRLTQQVEQHTKLKQKFSTINSQYQNFNSELASITQICQMQKTVIEKYKATIDENAQTIYNLTDTKESLQKQLEASNQNKLELLQSLTSKQIDIEQLQVELQTQKTNGVSQSSQALLSNLQKKISELQLSKSLLQAQNSDLQARLEQKIQIPDQNRDTQQEIISSQKLRWEEEKKGLLRDLQNRVDKVVQLQIELDDSKEKFRHLQSSMSQGERAVKKKNDALERNLQQLTLIYHQLVNQRSALNVQKQVNQRKISRLTESNSKLQKQLANLQEEMEKVKEELQEQRTMVKRITEQMEMMALQQPRMSIQGANRFSIGNSIVQSFTRNIRKTIKGGGGKLANFLPQKMGLANLNREQQLIIEEFWNFEQSITF